MAFISSARFILPLFRCIRHYFGAFVRDYRLFLPGIGTRVFLHFAFNIPSSMWRAWSAHYAMTPRALQHGWWLAYFATRLYARLLHRYFLASQKLENAATVVTGYSNLRGLPLPPSVLYIFIAPDRRRVCPLATKKFHPDEWRSRRWRIRSKEPLTGGSI